jgi:hypothetical protein
VALLQWLRLYRRELSVVALVAPQAHLVGLVVVAAAVDRL